LLLSIVPMLVMLIPMVLLLAQLALWYQARPLHIGEEAVVTLRLNDADQSPLPKVTLAANDAVEPTIGPVRALSQREVCWNLKALKNGYHRLSFEVDDRTADKELAIGDDFMRVSLERPNWSWSEALMHPAEQPFAPDSTFKSIEIAYPQRASWTSGA